MAALLDLYVGGDCISQHRKFKCAKKAFEKALKKSKDMDIDIFDKNGESLYAWDANNQEIYDNTPLKN